MRAQHTLEATSANFIASRFGMLLITVLLLCVAASASAQITPTKESLSGLYAGKAYSPYAQRSFPDQVFWGDTHLHTGLSMDAGLFGARLGLDDAYRFARGEEVLRRVIPGSCNSTRPSHGMQACRKAATPQLQRRCH